MRINSKQSRGAVLLTKAEHPFLDRDSWLHCWGRPEEVDDYYLGQLMAMQHDINRQGVLGYIAVSVREQVRQQIGQSPLLSPARMKSILSELQ